MKLNLISQILGGALLLMAGSCKQPVPYQTEAPAMLNEALAQAQAEGKWLLVDLGAPW